ncbi:nucleotidyltransferase domain-containing protein [Thermococcus indicus]|uniref:Nucleotidyltransferase domain-containing protein n=1 Tax=Thermococcus indicus TaxID=2586643 RepID=A0A4Y5SLS7_9EURY|nr:nucleotidyltransferase domain-containing protein [Thermococcus indicus]QDA31139.1 nucleotidyltransferase domain-containing protein [Thermococcus indicus]
MGHREVAEAFARDVRKLLGDNLVETILFGSVARGEQSEESDVDILVVVRDYPWEAQKKLADLVVDYLLKYGIYVSPKAISLEEFEFMKRINSSFYINISREGIPVG